MYCMHANPSCCLHTHIMYRAHSNVIACTLHSLHSVHAKFLFLHSVRAKCNLSALGELGKPGAQCSCSSHSEKNFMLAHIDPMHHILCLAVTFPNAHNPAKSCFHAIHPVQVLDEGLPCLYLAS